MLKIETATLHQMDAVRVLFREYQQALNIDLCFQGFEQELVTLPGKYTSILLAERYAGCVALRPFDHETAEMKRLYVRPRYRGTGLGRALTEAILEEARTRHYTAIRLDTLPQMTTAIALYRSLGFRDIPPYCTNPFPGALFLELQL